MKRARSERKSPCLCISHGACVHSRHYSIKFSATQAQQLVDSKLSCLRTTHNL
jgi:hypothetical protein